MQVIASAAAEGRAVCCASQSDGLQQAVDVQQSGNAVLTLDDRLQIPAAVLGSRILGGHLGRQRQNAAQGHRDHLGDGVHEDPEGHLIVPDDRDLIGAGGDRKG